MRTFVLILAMLAPTLAAQDKQTQKTEPQQITAQPESEQASKTETPPAAQQPQNAVKPTAKPAQPPPPQQLITFTADQLDEYENKILDRAEKFYAFVVFIMVMVAGVLIPLFVTGLIQYQRRISFAKELDTQSRIFNERLSKSKDSLEKYADDQIKTTSTALSMTFLAVGNLYSKEESPGGYGLTLQSYILAMKFYIISQCSGTSVTAHEIMDILLYQHKIGQINLETLKAAEAEIKNMEGDAAKIIDDEKRVDMITQVQQLQEFVHSFILVKEVKELELKEQNTDTNPPQAGPQQS